MSGARLPYADNAKAVFVTIAINVGTVFLFNPPGGIDYSGVLADSLICAVITTIVDLWIVYPRMKRMRSSREIPVQVPESGLMRRLPQNPVALGVAYAVAFGVLTVGANAVILHFFGMTRLAFLPWLVYKLIYSTVLTVILTEYIIFRYVQPDWVNAEGGSEPRLDSSPESPVKNPLPNIGMFKAIYGAVTGNIALNIIIGSLLGGVAARDDGSVVILPTTVEGIPITGLVFGLIIGILVTNGVVKAMNEVIKATPAILEVATMDWRITWLPRGRIALTFVVCLCAMVFSAVALRAILVLFDIPLLNFYQFTVFITIYATIIGKPLAFVLTKRCLQPDYIRYTLRKAKTMELQRQPASSEADS